MEKILFIDTETTGFKKNGAIRQDGQARVCQFAFILATEDKQIITKCSSPVRPDGWTISDGARDVHGLTDEFCAEYGVHQGTMMRMFNHLRSRADLIVAHNEAFDRGMMEIEEAYFFQADNARSEPWQCTMKSNTHIAGGKWPKLEATLKHYTGRTLGDKAHDALVDTEACMDIFFAMREMGNVTKLVTKGD